MSSVEIDLGKRRSYFVVEQDGSVARESCVKTERNDAHILLERSCRLQKLEEKGRDTDNA